MTPVRTCRRDLELVQRPVYDLIVVGGGIYGACLTLEASRRGWSVLLLEQDDFGGATSWNSLRIIHGGLRYLQTLDLRRHQESVREQAWWQHTFPQHIEPLPCLMPLYNQGLRRKWIMRFALTGNNWWTRRVRAKHGFSPEILPDGKLLDATMTQASFPSVRREGLVAGATWYDGLIRSPQRLMMEILRWSHVCGGEMLNYVRATDILPPQGNSATRVRAACLETGELLEFQGRGVILCRGGENQRLLPQQGYQAGYNLVVDRPPPSQAAVAVSPPQGGHTYFVVPYGDRSLVGTVYEPQVDGQTLAISPGLLDDTLADLNVSMVDWNLSTRDIVEVWKGILPTLSPGRLADRPKVIPHPQLGTCFSVVGVKYTTARSVAEQTLRRVCRMRGISFPDYTADGCPAPRFLPETKTAQDLQNWMQCEQIFHIDDLLLRRIETDRADCDIYSRAGEWMVRLGWDATRQELELERLRTSLNQLRPSPPLHEKNNNVERQHHHL